jgi:hypothetical protein
MPATAAAQLADEPEPLSPAWLKAFLEEFKDVVNPYKNSVAG